MSNKLIKIKFNGREFTAEKEEEKYATYYHIYADGKRSWESVKVYKNERRETYYITTNVCVELINEPLEELVTIE